MRSVSVLGSGRVDNYTKLLLHCNTLPFVDNSTRAFPVNNASGTSLNGAIYKFAPASAEFNGASKTLIVSPASGSVPTDLDFDIKDFTIDTWVYLKSQGTSAGGDDVICEINDGDWQQSTLTFYIRGSAIYLKVYKDNTELVSVSGAYPFAINTWYHVAAVRSGGRIDLYVNGNNVATTMLPSTGGGIDSFTRLMVHAEGVNGSTSFPDSSQYGYAPTVAGTVKVDTTNPKIGSGCAIFDGTNSSYISYPANDWNFGTADFTIDYWTNFTALGSYSYHWCWSISSSYYAYISGGTSFNVMGNTFTWSPTPSLGVWYHVALVRASGLFYFFLNGIQQGSALTNTTNYAIYTPFYLGMYAGSNYSFCGRYDEFRISKGIARWTSNFTPQLTPYDAGLQIPPGASGTYAGQLHVGYRNGGPGPDSYLDGMIDEFRVSKGIARWTPTFYFTPPTVPY